MRCKVCKKRALPVFARGRFREFRIGYYCKKCQRFAQKPGNTTKVESPVQEDLV